MDPDVTSEIDLNDEAEAKTQEGSKEAAQALEDNVDHSEVKSPTQDVDVKLTKQLPQETKQSPNQESSNGKFPLSVPSKEPRSGNLEEELTTDGPDKHQASESVSVKSNAVEGDSPKTSGSQNEDQRKVNESDAHPDSGAAYFTAKPELRVEKHEAEDDNAGRNLEHDFEHLATEEVEETNREPKAPAPAPSTAGSNFDRPGVTHTPHPALNGISSSQKGSPGGVSETVAKELAQAEAEADSAASQRLNAGKKNPPSVGIPDEDQAPFTEENLQSTGASPVLPRPMSPPPGNLPTFPPQEAMAQPSEPEEYRGLVFNDGVDSQGRPVVVINADALSPKASRKEAVQYLLQRLEPIVIQGPYVAVFLSTGTKTKKNKLSAGWLAACYRQMSYPFKKNVKFVILVRPSLVMNLMLTLSRPLIKKQRAWAKIKKVENLADIEAATNLEVSLQHLGNRFNTLMSDVIIKNEGNKFGQTSAYQMPTFANSIEMSNQPQSRS